MMMCHCKKPPHPSSPIMEMVMVETAVISVFFGLSYRLPVDRGTKFDSSTYRNVTSLVCQMHSYFGNAC